MVTVPPFSMLGQPLYWVLLQPAEQQATGMILLPVYAWSLDNASTLARFAAQAMQCEVREVSLAQ